MSELKARHIVDVYDSYYAENPFGERYQVYLKSEADKVIAELEMKLAAAKLVLRLNEPEALYSNLDTMSRLNHKIDVVERRELHQKYKRCLAMAMWCKSKSKIYNEFAADESEYMPSYEARFRSKAVLYQKWAMRWLGLAKKFKEMK